MKKFFAKKRKGFSLVELVVVILIIAILAVAVFAGGSAAIKKSQVSRTTSDLHNFSVAVESTMNENPSVANIDTVAKMDDLVLNKLNKNLPEDYKLTAVAADVTDDNLLIEAVNADPGTGLESSWKVFESAKTDAWGNHYYVVLDYGERHATGTSDFYITVISAGPNAQTTIGDDLSGADLGTGNAAKGIEADDIFLLTQYTDGNVTAATYNVATDKLYTICNASATSDGVKTEVANTADYVTTKGTAPAKMTVTTKTEPAGMYYCGGEAHAFLSRADVPVNF